ncbi:MAG: hypothetical protein U9N83_09460 [Thermodesulfobacteriota bacterium]|nr:hypothetical protein [Thermodesulfobacteriota bacterium]
MYHQLKEGSGNILGFKMDRPVWPVFPYPDKVLRPIGNQSGLEMDSKLKNFKKIPLLSKSRFIAGLQCPLLLWYQCYNSELATKPPPSQQVLFDTGHEVRRMAT